jgi:hypothetical protein
MNQKKDGQIDSTTHIVQQGMVHQTICSVNIDVFTILLFTSASGGIVYCVVIFTSNSKDGVDIQYPVDDGRRHQDYQPCCDKQK